jgi:BMFP domain-containing protein YqiC
MIDPKSLDALAAKITQGLPAGLGLVHEDLRNNIRAALSAALARMDLVTREEFDVQSAVLARTREKLTALEATVSELERNLKADQEPSNPLSGGWRSPELSAWRLWPGMPEGIVDTLEIIQIERHQRCRSPVTLRLPDCHADVFLQQTSVGQARDAIVVSEVTNTLLRTFTLGNVLHRPQDTGYTPVPIRVGVDFLVDNSAGAVRVQHPMLDATSL